MITKAGGIYLNNDLMDSEAYKKLGLAAIKVFQRFKPKEQNELIPKDRRKDWKWIKNRELVFSFKQAEEEFGIERHSFSRALDDLVKYGFIDPVKSGGGHHEPSKYRISERWKQYGTSKFKKVSRPKREVKFLEKTV